MSSAEFVTVRPRVNEKNNLQNSLLFVDEASKKILELYERLGFDNIITRSNGEILQISFGAQQHIGHGLEISKDNKIAASDRNANVELQELIAPSSGTQEDARRCVALTRVGARPLLVQCERQDALKFLLILDSGKLHYGARLDRLGFLLRNAFGLTPAESRLACELAKGKDLPSIAAQFAVGVGTLRVQLRLVFAKTSTCRQAELMLLLSRLQLL